MAEAKKRQMDAELEADRYFQSYKAEEKRRIELEELLKTQQPLKAVTDGQPDRAQLTRDKLTQEATKQAAKLEKQRENKKRRMQAFMLIQMFLQRKVIPKYRTKKANAAKDQLCNLLLGAVTRKKYGKTKAAVLKIQALIRGKIHRMRAKKIQEVDDPPHFHHYMYTLLFSSTPTSNLIAYCLLVNVQEQRAQQFASLKLQTLYRGKQGREEFKRRKFDDMMRKLQLKYQAAAVMQRLIKRFIAKLRWEKKRLQAVILIQRAERKHIFWSRFVLQRRHQAASVIGKAMEGRLAVRRAKEERKRLQDDKSVAVRVAELIERYRLMAAIFTETLPVRDTPLYLLYTLSFTLSRSL